MISFPTIKLESIKIFDISKGNTFYDSPPTYAIKIKTNKTMAEFIKRKGQKTIQYKINRDLLFKKINENTYHITFYVTLSDPSKIPEEIKKFEEEFYRRIINAW